MTVAILYYREIETSVIQSLADKLTQLEYRPEKISFGRFIGLEHVEAVLNSDVVFSTPSKKQLNQKFWKIMFYLALLNLEVLVVSLKA